MKRMKTYKKLDYQLAQDERTAPQQEKMFDGKTYYATFAQDIDNLKESLYLKIPRLNQALVNRLQQLHRMAMRIDTMSPEHLRGKSSQIQKQLLRQLESYGNQINLQPKIHDRLVVVDEHICWFGTVDYFGYPNGDTTTLRIVSEEWAKHFLNR